MSKKTVEQIADDLDKRYGSEPIGADFSTVLAEAVKAGGYTDQAEADTVKRSVGALLKQLRSGRPV